MLRVLTLNIGSFFEADWDERRHEIVAWVDRLDPDVICLQEVWQSAELPSTASWIVDAVAADYDWIFGGNPITWKEADDPSFRFGSAILSRWPIADSRAWRLPVADNPEDDYLTSMPWELVWARTAGLDIFTCHLAAAPSHGRHRVVQVQEIDRLVRDVRGDRDVLKQAERDPMPAILTGDFNAEPASDEIRFLKGHAQLGPHSVFWQDAWEVAGEGGPGLTQDWRTHPLAAQLNVHRKRIDYVFVGDPFLRAGGGGRVLAAEVVADKPLTGIQASDHCGLLVEIAWPTRPA